MKTPALAFAAGLIQLSLASLPAAVEAQAREARPLEGFDAIQVSGGIDLYLRQGAAFVVEVEGSTADVVTEVHDRTLDIRRKGAFSFFSWRNPGSVHITLPALVSLMASGGSDVRAEGIFSSDELKLVASGGSDVVLEIAVAALHVEASGGSDIRLSGSARSATVISSGGSDLNASRLIADEADVQSSGGSDLTIGVRDKIVGNASGGSDVSYSGTPRMVNVTSSGGADVHVR
jgi:hypothetical protein